MRVSWLFCIPLALAMTPEYTHVLKLVSTALQEQSPRGNPLYWACPQGAPGIQGMTGRNGKNQLETVKERVLLPPPPFVCDVNAAARVIMDKLLQLPHYNTSFPNGPPGPPGQMTSQALLNQCSRTTAIVPHCEFTAEIYNSFASLLSVPLHCPPRLEGGMGPRGNQGSNALCPKES